MLFDEDGLLVEGQEVIKKVEENLRLLKIEYQKALVDYNYLKDGNTDLFEEMEPRYLKLLSKLQKSIETTIALWDKSISSVEKIKAKRKEKVEYFLTGVIWTLDETSLTAEQKKEIVDEAKKLIT